jgi:hypothetical protein
MNLNIICKFTDKVTQLEGDDHDDSSGKGGGTSTGATGSHLTGMRGSGKDNSKGKACRSNPSKNVTTSKAGQNNNSGRLHGDGTSTEAPVLSFKGGIGRGKLNSKSGGSGKSDGKDSSNTDAAMKMHSIEESAPSNKSCLHCGEELLYGQKVRLHECACGKVYHHLCAGKVDHTEYATCFDCSRKGKPESKATMSDQRSTLRKALDTLSEAHQSLLKLSSELQLCSANESKQKAQQFDKACTTVTDHVISSWRTWSGYKSAPPDETRELQDLIGHVLVLVKGTGQQKQIDFVLKKVQGKNSF